MARPGAAVSIIYLGMDVHKDSITIAVLPMAAKNPTRLEGLPNDLPKFSDSSTGWRALRSHYRPRRRRRPTSHFAGLCFILAASESTDERGRRQRLRRSLGGSLR